MNQVAEFFSKLFNYSDWPPRWHCGKWSEFHGWLYIVSDLLIWSAYFTLPLVIIKYVARRSDAKFVKLYFLFAAFILACGATHLLDAVTFWYPVYRLSALLRFTTGVISWVTVFYIIRYLPVAFSLRSQKELENEINQRKKVENELRDSEEQVQAIIKNAPDPVIVFDNNGLIKKWNPAAGNMFGWEEKEVIEEPVGSILVLENSEILMVSLKEILLNNQSLKKDMKVIKRQVARKDGEIIDIEITFSPVKIKEDEWYIAFLRDSTVRNRAENALKESEERYRLLTSEVYDYSIIMLSPEGFISSWNEGAQRIKGYTEDEIIGKHFSIFYPNEVKESNFPEQELLIARKEGRFENEGWRVKKDGTFFWANMVMTTVKKNGEVIGFSKITKDISERKKAEEEIKLLNISLEQRVVERTNELQQSEKKYRKLFENSPLPMWVIELPSLKFLDVNEAAIGHYGYSRNEFLSMNAIDIRPDDEKQRYLNFDHSPTNGLTYSGAWKHLKKDGSLIYVDINSHEMNIGDSKGRLILSQDITERKKAEERLDFALEAGKIGIWELDLQTNTSVRNLRHDQIFGYEEMNPEWGMKIFLSHLHPDDLETVEASFNESLKTQNWLIETRIIWPDQSIHWVLINGKLIGNDKAPQSKIMGTVIEITALKKVEEEVRRLNNDLEARVKIRTRELYAANKELESFSYSVSHDLRAPLRAINGYSQILLEDYENKLDEEGKKLLSRVVFNANKMGQLIDDLLEFSRLGKKALNKAEIDLDIMVKEIVDEQLQTNKFPHAIIAGQLGIAIADEGTIRLVFQNLLLNAFKYSSKKENPVIEIGVIETDKGNAYFVKDNGAGFDMTYYDKLFGVFQRLHRQEEFEGTGVGLAIVQRIILRHSGQVWAESEVDKGATFYFTLQ